MVQQCKVVRFNKENICSKCVYRFADRRIKVRNLGQIRMPLYYYYQTIATCKQGPFGQYWNSSSKTALFFIKTNMIYYKRFFERKDRFGWKTEFLMVELSLSVDKNVMVL